MLKKNSKGFGLVEGLLVVVLVAAIGFVIWQVNTTDETVSDSTVNSQSASDQPVNQAATIPDGWVEYQNETFGVSFIHPADWTIVEEDGNEENGLELKLLPPNNTAVVSIQNYVLGFGGVEPSVFETSSTTYMRYEIQDRVITYLAEGVVEGQEDIAEVRILDEEGREPGSIDDEVRTIIRSFE